MKQKWIYHVDEPLPESVREPKDLLGGKGASLHGMTRAGLPVPSAFVITTEACAYFLEHDGEWPPGLREEVKASMRRLEEETGRTFGAGAQPLLVSVRSGAARSMPGMMDTLLNVGLHPGLAEEVPDPSRFWELYGEFVLMYGKTLAGMAPERFAELEADPSTPEGVKERIALYEKTSGGSFPGTAEEVLFSCIEHVFRSWNNDRALHYRERNDIRGLKGTAVNVQVMFPSHVSGIVFTRNPTDLAEEIVIESSYGLGEAVVSGDVTPDKFVVDLKSLELKSSTLGQKTHSVGALGDSEPFDPDAFSLTPEQIQELCRLSLDVEAYLGCPTDIEFGLSEGTFGLLQSRAIRGLDVLQDVETGRQEEIERLRALAGEQTKVWVTHNLGETLRFPTPMTWEIICEFMSGDGGFGHMYRHFGYLPSAEVKREGFLELICGRIYADPDRLAGLFWDGMPMRYDLEKLVDDPSLMDSAPTRFDPDAVEPEFLLQAPKIIAGMVRSSRRMKEARQSADQRFETEVLPEFLAYIRREEERDLEALETSEVLESLRERRHRVLTEFGAESLIPGFLGGMAMANLSRLLHQLDQDGEGAEVSARLTTALDGDVTFEQDKLLYDIAHGNGTLDSFLERFGHRCLGEMELMNPRYRENTDYLEGLLEQLAKGDRDPADSHHENARKYEETLAGLPETLERWGGSSFREEIESLVAEARRLLPYRESGKYYLMMGYALIRDTLRELARRWDLGTEIYFLRPEELGSFESDRESLLTLATERRIRWQSAQKLDLPDVVQSAELEKLGLPPETTTVSLGEWEGSSIASGVASGPVRRVFNPAEAGDLGSGYILVCPSTDPGWTPLFINAAGLVVEKGGVLSHGAIVARDFGIPAVVCANATNLVSDGDQVRVDGNRGIFRLET